VSSNSRNHWNIIDIVIHRNPGSASSMMLIIQNAETRTQTVQGGGWASSKGGDLQIDAWPWLKKHVDFEVPKAKKSYTHATILQSSRSTMLIQLYGHYGHGGQPPDRIGHFKSKSMTQRSFAFWGHESCCSIQPIEPAQVPIPKFEPYPNIV
jgi:hypothetical protein